MNDSASHFSVIVLLLLSTISIIPHTVNTSTSEITSHHISALAWYISHNTHIPISSPSKKVITASLIVGRTVLNASVIPSSRNSHRKNTLYHRCNVKWNGQKKCTVMYRPLSVTVSNGNSMVSSLQNMNSIRRQNTYCRIVNTANSVSLVVIFHGSSTVV